MSDSKGSFMSGLIVGVIIAAIGFFALSNTTLDRGDDQDTDTVVEDDGGTQPDINDNNDPGTPDTDIQVTSADRIRGNVNASVTIVEFSDFQCPFCARFHTTMLQVMDEYPNDVRWVYKHFPLDSIHPIARKAAEASECAGDQNKFWEYADALYENQTGMTEATLTTIAKTVGLNASTFSSCLDSGKYASKVEADYQAGIAAGVRGTPGNFINGQSLAGAQPFESVKAMIDSQL